jgi:hypothetical protein
MAKGVDMTCRLWIALCGLALFAPVAASADGFRIEGGRYAGGPVTVLALEAQQKAAIDAERELVLTEAQQDALAQEVGTRASRFLVYDLRREENDCTCNAANVAFRFSDGDVEIPHAYLVTDAEAARLRAELDGE